MGYVLVGVAPLLDVHLATVLPVAHVKPGQAALIPAVTLDPQTNAVAGRVHSVEACAYTPRLANTKYTEYAEKIFSGVPCVS